MAKIKRSGAGLRPEIRQVVRKPNILQKGVRNIIHFIRPVKPEISGETSPIDPDSSGNSIPEPVEEGSLDPDSGGTTSPDPEEATGSTSTGTDPTNPVNNDDMEQFIGEIRLFAGNFAPRGWALCDGQTLDIATNQSLYSLLGTYYGGDGRVNFKLPDLRGRVPIHQGQGTGLTNHPIGSIGGIEDVALSIDQMPIHKHTVKVAGAPSDSPHPENNLLSSGDHNHYSQGDAVKDMDPGMIADSGAGQSHTNMQPYLTINYIIALEGVYPIRS